MFFSPNTAFLLNPIPRSPWESFKTAGNENPVFDSVTTSPEPSERDSEPHRGEEREKLESNEFNALWRDGLVVFCDKQMPAEMPAPIAAETATEQAIFAGEKAPEGTRVVAGWENKNGKRRDTIVFSGEFDTLIVVCCLVGSNWSVDLFTLHITYLWALVGFYYRHLFALLHHQNSKKIPNPNRRLRLCKAFPVFLLNYRMFSNFNLREFRIKYFIALVI